MSNAEGDTLPIDEAAADSGSASHVENRQAEGSCDPADMSAQARQRRKIAQLEEKLVALESGRAFKERYNRPCSIEFGFSLS